MSEQIDPNAPGPVTGDGTAAPATDEVGRDSEAPDVDNGSGPRPGDPADQELTEVGEAMAQVRAGVPAPDGAPTVPDDDEVAGLERAHDVLRSTLDRVDRGG